MNKKHNNFRLTALFSGGLIVAALLVLTNTTYADHGSRGKGMVASIQKAPVTADGDVTGMPMDYVITLSGSLDPGDPGRSLAAGDVIKVRLPRDFDLGSLNPAYPLLDAPTPLPPLPVLSDNDCVPAYLTCTTSVLLRGWPQDPYFPPALFHKLSIDAAKNTLVITALKDIGPTAGKPGIKEIHLIFNGVTNPRPGKYRVGVKGQTGPGGSWERGYGELRVLPRTRPSINITSVFVKAGSGQLGAPACGPGTNPPNSDNPIYQTTAAGTAAPFPWTFLLWGHDNEPLTEVRLKWVNRKHAFLLRGRYPVGHVKIDAPHNAKGYGIAVNPLGCDTYMGAAPVIAATPGIGPQPVGRLDMQFTAGDKPGVYTTTITMRKGNKVKMVVTAE